MEKNTFLDFGRRILYGLFPVLGLAIFLIMTSFDGAPASTTKFLVVVDMYTDADGDGVPDYIDIDDDNDGILDSVEDNNLDGDNDPLTNPYDKDSDGIPNHLDIDSDGDGILDNIEGQSSSNYIAPSGIDANNNGLDDAYENDGKLGIEPINTDRYNGGNGFLPDYLDVDSDIDGIRDNVEAQSFKDYVGPSGTDSNANGLDDAYEGAYGFGIIPLDSDEDGIPDYRDFDSDNDGIKDKVEAQTSEGYIPPSDDKNCNDIDDAYEDGLNPIDTDSDSIPDYRDIDSDNDGILDNVESQTIQDYVAPSGIDDNGDGMDDVYGLGGIDPINSDADSLPDFRDIDSDDDGIPDNVEAQSTAGYILPNNDDAATYESNDGLNSAYLGGLDPEDTDGDGTPDYLDEDSDDDLVADNNEGNDFNYDGIPDWTYTGTDTDNDGLDDGYEGSDVNDGYDVNDEIEDPATDLPDTDGTEDVNYRDIDDDGDGIDTPDEDANEDGDPTNDDTDEDGTPDYLDPDSGGGDDTDGDGVTDDDEEEDGTDPSDACDFILANQTVEPSSEWKTSDCDGDGVTNEDEKEDGTDPLDPCDYNPDHVTLPQSGDYLTADCDGDGVTNEDEEEDGTDPNDACDFVLDSQTLDPSSTWNTSDCDGDGVTNEDEKEDGTDPLDPCDYNPDHVTLPQSGEYLTADCDGDGVTNEDEEEDGTDPNDACDFVLDSQTVDPSSTWNTADCDGDGVTNEDEIEDGTDPLDPCDYNPESITLEPSPEWKELDCDGDGNPNGTDPNPLEASAADDSGSTPALTEVAINILENDDYLPNNNENNVGVTSLSRIGGTAAGVVSFDPETGFMTYTPTELESNSTVTVVYQVCNVLPDPNVCATATVTIEVGANTIDAVDDSYTGNGDIADSDVLSNDTLNGEPATLLNVILTSTSTDELTINPDGSVSVNPGTAEGTYTITYTICEIANVDNCDTATVTVEVVDGMANAIDAVDDSYTGNGDIADSDVLSNDTLNGEAVTLADVILTSTPTDELTINPDGSVSVNPGTAEGIYSITYTICEIDNVENCDTATVTVEVTEGMANVIDAVDDFYNEEAGGGVIPNANVLLNDRLDGEEVNLVDVILTSDPTNSLMINDDGTITVASEITAGEYTIEYTICEAGNPENCDTATVTVIIEEIEVNQMVTPNGDLKNDFLFIRGVSKIKSSTLQIFNRWGVAVYEGKNYDNVRNVFDGRSRGRSSLSVNDYLPAGVYFYIFNYETEKGSFTDTDYIYISR